MICPACRSEKEMAYSVLAHGFVCVEPGCELELFMEQQDIDEILHPDQQLAYA